MARIFTSMHLLQWLPNVAAEAGGKMRAAQLQGGLVDWQRVRVRVRVRVGYR